MWQPNSIPTIADPAAARTHPSRQAIAQQAYLDKQRSQAATAGRRFRWARHLRFTS
jgi:hypothetical protein